MKALQCSANRFGGKIEYSSAGRENYKYRYQSKHIFDDRGFKTPERREIQVMIGAPHL